MSSTSRPLYTATGSSHKAGGRLPGRRSPYRCQGLGSYLSQPLNWRERARARCLACDWRLGRGRRRPSCGTRSDLSLHYLWQLAPKRRARRLGNDEGGGGAYSKSSRLIGSLGTYSCLPEKKSQIPACAVDNGESQAGEGGRGGSVAPAQTREPGCRPFAVIRPTQRHWGREART